MTWLVGRVRAVPTWQATLFVALVALGFLVAAQVRSETPRVQYTSQERAPLIQTTLALQAQQDGLKAQILDLRNQIDQAERNSQGSDALVTSLNDALLQARLAAGLVAVHGLGLVIQLDDSDQPVPQGGSQADYLVTGRDVRTVVEGLWLAGAEAVAVNAERVTPTTAIIDIGGSILVNSAYLAPPYQVKALGPAGMYDKLVASAGFVDLVTGRAQKYGIKISFAEPQDLVIPAYAGNVSVIYGHVVVLPSPSVGPSTAPSATPSVVPSAASPRASTPAPSIRPSPKKTAP